MHQSLLHGYAHRDGYRYPHRYRDANRLGLPDSYPDAYTDPHPDPYADAHPYAKHDAYWFGNSHCHALAGGYDQRGGLGGDSGILR
jgi:hypothetical protein